MGRITSVVWEFFEKNETGTKVKCKNCDPPVRYKFSGSTSAMKRHLKAKHLEQLLQKAPDIALEKPKPSILTRKAFLCMLTKIIPFFQLLEKMKLRKP